MLNPLVNMVFKDHIDVVKHVEEKYAVSIENMASELFSVLDSGGTLFWCGNGGSASDAQHISAELVGRFQVERKGLRSISLTADTALVTAVSNDYGYDNLFARQVEALMSADDALIGISTSGNSRNVVNALHAANRIGAKTLGLFGSDGGGGGKRLRTVRSSAHYQHGSCSRVSYFNWSFDL